MSVVLRCPNCGTTRETPGECEACGEAQVRYFCTNHSPGIWLAERACPGCGARFGERQRSAAPAAAVIPLRSPAPTRSAGLPSMPAPASRSAPSPKPAPPFRGESPRSITLPPTDDELETSSLYRTPWQRALSAALRARRAAILARGAGPPPVGIGGCLRRFLLTMGLLLIALATALFFFGRAVLHVLQP